MTIKIGKFVKEFSGAPADGCTSVAPLTKDGKVVGEVTAWYTNAGRWDGSVRIEYYEVELGSVVGDNDSYEYFYCVARRSGDALRTPAEAKRLLREWVASVT